MLLTLIILHVPSTVMAIATNITPYIPSPLMSSRVDCLQILSQFFILFRASREMIMCGNMGVVRTLSILLIEKMPLVGMAKDVEEELWSGNGI